MIRAIIVEDEEIAVIRLKSLIEKIDPEIHIDNVFPSVRETVLYLHNESPDLIFLDVNLSDGYSFEIFEQIKVTQPIIFITAYSEYAIKAFEQNSISYLLKPIEEEALTKAIKKYKQYNHTSSINYSLLSEMMTKPSYKMRFLVKTNSALTVVDVSEISYFYFEDKVTFIKLWNKKCYPLDYSLKQLESLLDPITFFRINKKYIISPKSIDKMYYTSKSRIRVYLSPINEKDSAVVLVALEKVSKFKKWLSV
ncbi:LytR/AlgR family response regulator transcription factor [Aquimarina algicola]|uniref:Response regulator transcription factor n=1 Tax=Aquimarina algicola TaxID=2589995 RepID=A0A504J0N7_9FLAO|nr:LytTR family DNA-binding domain-containing protein [Aquimarina algicola]TPN83974.1 response regulator transcription factor [Aquimarina algicola]